MTDIAKDIAKDEDPAMTAKTKMKLKTHRGAAKRFHKTGSGFKRKGAFRSHILSKMSTKRKRQLRGTRAVHPADLPGVKRMLREN